MRILIVGSGGREHALAWKIAQSPRVEKIFVTPGNDGLAEVAEPVTIKAGGIEDLADWAEKNRIDFTVVGPEVPLALGRSEEHTSELQSRPHLVCRLLLEKKKPFAQPVAPLAY